MHPTYGKMLGWIVVLSVSVLLVEPLAAQDLRSAKKLAANTTNTRQVAKTKRVSKKQLAEKPVRTKSVKARPVAARSAVAADNASSLSNPDMNQTLDKALDYARQSLKRIRESVVDYRCKIIKRERINGRLRPTERMECKFRSRKVVDGIRITPMSVSLYFLQPKKSKGRKVVYVEGKHNGKALVTGIGRLIRRLYIKPDGRLAMRGQRYPLTEVGIENLAAKLLEKGMRDRQHGECEVKIGTAANLDGRQCTVIEVRHPVKRPHFDFHLATVYIDKELNVPIRYAAYSWPSAPGGKPVLEEEYTYLDLELNVGLKDSDFD